MKKIVLICLVAMLGIGVCAAQNKKGAEKARTTVFVTDIDCEHCVRKIMDNVPSLGKGVKDVKVDVATKQVAVTYDPAKNSDENIVKGLASLKVKAEVAKGAAEKK